MRLRILSVLLVSFIGSVFFSSVQSVASHQTNQHPVAKIVNQTVVQAGRVVVFDASSSYDPDDRYLEFHWSLVSKPEGSLATLSFTTGPVISLTADLVGNYIVGLQVNDPHGNTTYTMASASAIGPPLIIDVSAIARILDRNYNRRLDDEEILEAMRLWILALPLGTSNLWIGDQEMLRLITLWVQEAPVP